MKILTWETLNFGDRLNEFVWPNYIEDKINDDDEDLLVGIGSLLNHRLPAKAVKYILGSGVGHGDLPTVDETWRVAWVRGPLSAKTLGMPESRAISDGAILIADMIAPSAHKAFKVSFIPHCSANRNGAIETLESICAGLGINLINPEWPVHEVLSQIGSSERVITEALHGAISADALRVPWQPVSRSGVYSFKWHDWTSSMGLAYKPKLLAYRPQWYEAARHPRLSRRLIFPFLRPISKVVLAHQLKSISESQEWQLSESKTLAGKIADIKRALRNLPA